MSLEPGRIGRFVQGPLLAGVLIVLITEGLGAVSLLRPIPVGLAWLCVGIGCLYMVRRFPGAWRWHPGLRDGFRNAPFLWSVITLLLALTFVTGFFGAPNVWDGLTYHLPRVERWVEQGHLGFWPTSVDRQLWMAPWNGYAILQFRLLTGGDRLAFLPSWLVYLGCVLLTARVVRQLGGDHRQAALGALIFAAMPVAVLHASSVQTDLAAAFWVLTVAALSLESWQRRTAATDWSLATLLGLAVGLAVATKGTVLLALVPWLVLYATAVVRGAGWGALIRPLLVGACAVLVLNGAHFARNMTLFGDPLGDATTRGFLRLTPWTISGAIANLMANLSLHLGAPWSAWNEWWTDALMLVQRKLLGIDPAVLFPYFGGFRVQPYSTHEALTGNPVHLLLSAILLLFLAVRWRALRGRAYLPWVVAGLAAVVLQMTIVRWQPYGARLQLASLVWLAPMLAIPVRAKSSRAMVATLVVLLAIPALMMNHLRPLVSSRSVLVVAREDQYFAERPALKLQLDRVIVYLSTSGCSQVDLAAGYDSPEYLMLLGVRRLHSFGKVDHVLPRSRSATLIPGAPVVSGCAIVIMNRADDLAMLAAMLGARVIWYETDIGILTPSN